MKIVTRVVFLILTLSFYEGLSQNKLEIEGVINDSQGNPIPYVSVHIPTKQIGTTSTEEGKFYLALDNSNLQETLVVSSMGFKTFTVKIEDFMQQDIATITLQDAVTSLETVEVMSASKSKDYVAEALKESKNTFISDNHELKLIYRRASVEQNVSKFFVEHYMSFVYKGPKSAISRLQVNEARVSADYRIAPEKQWDHAAVYMVSLNPLTGYHGSLKSMDWVKVDDTTYDGEDVMILEGTKKTSGKGKKNKTILYIGFDTNNIYRIENSVGNSVYQYVKNADGKLYLSYHKREYGGQKKISEFYQKGLKLKKPFIHSAIKHEAIVLSVETDKKKFTAQSYEEHNKDMNEVVLPYHPIFWKNLSLPPDTAFYKKIKQELEENYGVPLEKQYNLVNK
ncbi:carboxypeptidase-like regulatory domain-containing protein [Urechidicola vernalis]|uniref:Carboxypeptidase-like regulatory domain-containing protein n=1 Tax=Urechidicola vernalis TaxID=3075600 RepID=A0ABU2Y2C6_9FLAO|nr:carboxypeptidase-like regulatory domain-containing protein [Urechidicola sp. P050]MDT0551852.1 carboxypeptidase-like regulatory domain-containing protein [Urechidicola sp. P050]